MSKIIIPEPSEETRVPILLGDTYRYIYESICKVPYKAHVTRFEVDVENKSITLIFSKNE